MDIFNYALKESKTVELYKEDLIKLLKESIFEQTKLFQDYSTEKNEKYIETFEKKASAEHFFIKEDYELLKNDFNKKNLVCIGDSIRKEITQTTTINNSIIRGFNKKIFADKVDIFTFNKKDFGFETELTRYEELKENKQESINLRIRIIELLIENKVINYCKENEFIIQEEFKEILERIRLLKELNASLKYIRNSSLELNLAIKELKLTDAEVKAELNKND